MDFPLATALDLDIRRGEYSPGRRDWAARDVRQSTIDANACFLTMNHADASYVGRLHFDHQGFCQQLCELLQLHYGRRIEEIGGLDIP